MYTSCTRKNFNRVIQKEKEYERQVFLYLYSINILPV